MRKAALLSLAGALLALAAAGAPASAHSARGGPSPTPLTLVPTAALGPSHGGIATGPYGYLPLHARELAHAKAEANIRANAGGHGKPGRGGGSPTVYSYPNVSPSFNGTYMTGLTPPDTTGAIGPDRYIETVNTQFAIYTRTGSLVSSGDLASLTGIPGGFFGYGLSDPQVMWDAKTQRFYYSAIYYDPLFLSDNGIAVGWSTTASPSSSADFCQYAIGFGADLPDYPHLGDSADFLIYGFNQFGDAASTYQGSGIVTLNKPPAGSTCPDTSGFTVYSSGFLHNADASLAATPIPANLVDDSTGTGYVVANADLTVTPSASFVSVYAVTTSGTDANGLPIPSVSAATNVPVPSYSIPANAVQAGSAYRLDTLDGRFEAAVAAVDPGHGGKVGLWTAHAVFGGAGSEERWYELDPAGGSVLQSGTVGSSSLSVWNGAVSPDRASNGVTGAFGDSMAMSVSTSSATTYPAIQLVWKKGANAQSALSRLVQAGGPSIDFSCSDTAPCRWGDYSGASPDPAATGSVGRVWLANQYNVAGGTTSGSSWRTWVFAVTPS